MINMYLNALQVQPESLTANQELCEEEHAYELGKNYKRNSQNRRLDSSGWRKNLRNSLTMGDGNGNTRP